MIYLCFSFNVVFMETMRISKTLLSFIAKAAKVGAVVGKAVVSKSCAAKGSRRAQNACNAHFQFNF